MAEHFNVSATTSKMAQMQRACMLKPMQAEHQTIQLNAGKNIVGRSRETGIRDTRCSKQQLLFDVSLDKAEIKLKVLGLNPCGVNGLMCVQDTTTTLTHGDIIEIVYGRHPFEIIFKPPPLSPTLPLTTDKAEENTDSEMCYPNRCKIDIVDKARNFEQKKMCSQKCKSGLEKMFQNNNPCQVDVEKIKQGLIQPPVVNAECDNKSTESWDSADNGKLLIYTSAGMIASDKIASYDLDGTLIRTKSGNVFPKSIDDWQLFFYEVPKRLKALHENNYKICIFTNQGGIAKGKVDVNGFKQKIRAILAKLDVPVQVFISTDDGYFRKPLPGMWEYMEHHKNCDIKIDKRKSFFVGDAAGRPQIGTGSTKRPKDHSLVDRFFASNIGIAFFTPEEHFYSRRTEKWIRPEFDPSTVGNHTPLLNPDNAKLKLATTQIIIMVGLPGSGKSHFVQNYLAPLGLTIANADTLGSVKICMQVCDKALSSNLSCVVDNTNIDVDSRKKFIEIAQRYTSVRCRCFVMNVPVAQIKHNLAFRKFIDSEHSVVSDMVFNMMKKKYKAPELVEGFDEIVQVNLTPKFSDIEHERLYKLYLLEK